MANTAHTKLTNTTNDEGSDIQYLNRPYIHEHISIHSSTAETMNVDRSIPPEISNDSGAQPVEPEQQSPLLEEEEVKNKTASRYYGLKDVFFATTLIFIPFVALNLAFTVVITTSRYRPSNSNPYETKGFNDAFYIRLGATSFAFLTSLSSTLATSLIGLVMTLVSFFAARHFSNLSQQAKFDQLPTPFQIGLLIRILDGAILDSFRHLLKRKEGTELRKLVKSTLWALVIVNLIVYHNLSPGLKTH